jgi:hypothetical protein
MAPSRPSHPSIKRTRLDASSRHRQALDHSQPSRSLMRRALVSLVLFLLVLVSPVMGRRGASAETGEAVDLLLVLAADVSRSVDAKKFKLQREGYAAAIVHPRVIAAIQATPAASIAICYVEWSGSTAQSVLVDWTRIASRKDAEAFAGRILAAPRLFMDRTAIGAAIDFSLAQLARAPFPAARRVIDVSGDGTSNSGRDVVAARDEALAQGIVINGLAILSEVPLSFNPLHTHPPGGLLKYYEDNVIGGSGAFALAAESHDVFPRLVLNKLEKEIALAPPAGGIRLR